MSRRTLALFAKRPGPGEVKTRLCPPLTPSEAAGLYEAMLLDILDQHPAEPELELALWYAPPDAGAWFERAVPSRYALHAQRGDGLSARMAALFREHARRDRAPIVLRGTDSPTLPVSRIGQAFAALEWCDLVLCPDRDGGYNLIGLREPCDALFELEMSTESVLERTLERARRRGLRVELLDPHYDVDTALELAWLERDANPEATPRTLGWFRHKSVRDAGAAS